MADEKKVPVARINEDALATSQTAAQREALEERHPHLTYPSKPPDGYAQDGSVIDPERHAEAMRQRAAILNPPVDQQADSEEKAQADGAALVEEDRQDMINRANAAAELQQQALAQPAEPSPETKTTAPATNSASTPGVGTGAQTPASAAPPTGQSTT